MTFGVTQRMLMAGLKPKFEVVWIKQRSHWLRKHNIGKWPKLERHIGIDGAGQVVVLKDTPPAPLYHAKLPGDTVSLCDIYPHSQTRVSRPGQWSKPLSWARAPKYAEVTCHKCLRKIRAVLPPVKPAPRIKPAFRKPDPKPPKEPTGPKIRKSSIKYYTRPRNELEYAAFDEFDAAGFTE